MDVLTLARWHALGRVVLGAGMVLAPARVGTPWIGRVARQPQAQLVIAALGARDLGLGLGAAWALGGGDGAAPWLRACALADAVDLAATLRARHVLSASAVAGVSLLAGGSAALGVWFQSRLD